MLGWKSNKTHHIASMTDQECCGQGQNRDCIHDDLGKITDTAI